MKDTRHFTRSTKTRTILCISLTHSVRLCSLSQKKVFQGCAQINLMKFHTFWSHQNLTFLTFLFPRTVQSRVSILSAPNAPKSRTSSYLPWFWHRRARLFNCLATSGWSFPNTWGRKKQNVKSRVLAQTEFYKGKTDKEKQQNWNLHDTNSTNLFPNF